MGGGFGLCGKITYMDLFAFIVEVEIIYDIVKIIYSICQSLRERHEKSVEISLA